MAKVYNIDAAYVKAEALNSDLAAADEEVVSKYLKRAINLCGGYVSLGQFMLTTDNYTFPDDLKDAIVYITEIIYINGGMFEGKANYQSESIGDYSYNKGTKQIKSDGVDLPLNIKAIMNKYRTKMGFMDPSIGGRDREYNDTTETPFIQEGI